MTGERINVRRLEDISTAQKERIASDVLGQALAFDAMGRAYCVCPGQAFHTQKNGRRDTRVYLDGRAGGPVAPTIHCLHASCQAEVKAATQRLRSAIGREKFRQALEKARALGRVKRSGQSARRGTPAKKQTRESAPVLAGDPGQTLQAGGWGAGVGVRQKIVLPPPTQKNMEDPVKKLERLVQEHILAWKEDHGEAPDAICLGEDMGFPKLAEICGLKILRLPYMRGIAAAKLDDG